MRHDLNRLTSQVGWFIDERGHEYEFSRLPPRFLAVGLQVSLLKSGGQQVRVRCHIAPGYDLLLYLPHPFVHLIVQGYKTTVCV